MVWRLVREETHHPRLQTTSPSTSLVRSGSADFGEAQEQMSKHQKNARDNFEEQLLRLPSDSLGCPWLLEFQDFQAKASVKIIHIGVICSIHCCASHLLQTIGTRSVEKGGKCVRKVAWNWLLQFNWIGELLPNRMVRNRTQISEFIQQCSKACVIPLICQEK